MGRQMIKTTIETIETTGFTLKQRLRIETNTLSQKLSLLSLKKNLCKDMFFLDMKNMLSDKKTCAEWLQHPRSCIIFVKKAASRVHPIPYFTKFV